MKMVIIDCHLKTELDYVGGECVIKGKLDVTALGRLIWGIAAW